MWPCRVASGCPVPASHSRTVPSAPPLASSRPSADSATPQTAPVWPCSVASGRPLPAPPTAAPSRPHRRWPPAAPSADSATPRTAPVWPCSVARSCPLACLPQPHRPVAAAAGHQPAVRGQRHAPDPAGVALQGGQRPPAVRLPQPHRPVRTAAGQQPPVGGQRHAPDRAGVALHRQQRRAVRHPPQPHLARRRPGRQQRAIGAQRDRGREVERLGQHRSRRGGHPPGWHPARPPPPGRPAERQAATGPAHAGRPAAAAAG